MSDMKTNETPRLGKGLEALIPKSFFASGKTITNLKITDIIPNPYQPRHHFNEAALQSLSLSIKQHGLAQPVVVRRNNDSYELVAGERRFRACQLAGMDVIPAIVRDMSDKDSLKIALIENLEREDLNAIEEAKGYLRLIDEFALTHQELGDMFGKSRSAISNTLRLLKLPEEIQQAVTEDIISEGHARSLLSIENNADRMAQFYLVKKGNLNVREVEAIVKNKKVRQNDTKKSSQLSLFSHLEEDLTNRYHMPFKIRGGKRGGKMTIRFANTEQLDRVIQVLKQS